MRTLQLRGHGRIDALIEVTRRAVAVAHRVGEDPTRDRARIERHIRYLRELQALWELEGCADQYARSA